MKLILYSKESGEFKDANNVEAIEIIYMIESVNRILKYEYFILIEIL